MIDYISETLVGMGNLKKSAYKNLEQMQQVG
jgi:hypothetical protein